MDAGGDACEDVNLTIEDLPNELLFDILKWIKKEPDLDNVQQVCRRWYSVIDGQVGRVVSTLTQRVIHPSNPNRSRYGLSLIPEIGVSKLVIGPNNDLLKAPPSSPLPSFKYPYLLKTLDVNSPIHPDLLRNLVKDTVNLEEFFIPVTALVKLQSGDMKNLNLPKLTSLTLRRVSGNREAEIFSDPTNLLILFEEHRFPHLTRLGVDFSMLKSRDLELLKEVLLFIQGHHNLKELSVGVAPFHVNPVATDEDLQDILKLVKNCTRANPILKFRMKGGILVEDNTLVMIWREFVQQQSGLRVLDLETGGISSAFLGPVCQRNAQTLKKLRIGRICYVRGEPPLDCSVFSPLQFLHTLHLWNLAELTGARAIPCPVKVLVIFGCDLQSDEVEQILLHLPNLEDVCLSNVGRRMNGVTVDTLQQFIGNRKVRKATLEIELLDYPLEGLPNNDPVNPQMLKVSPAPSLNWELNRDGYYIIAEPHNREWVLSENLFLK